MEQSAPDGIQRVGSETSTNSNTPAEKEGSKEGSLQSTDEDNRLYSKVNINRFNE